MSLLKKIEHHINSKKWRKENQHNSTYIVGDCNYSLISVGKYTYGGIYALTFNTTNRLIIGSFCSIAPNVTFVVSAEHNLKSISSFPYRVKVLGEKFEGISKGDIIIDNDVWIGYGATILSGVHIGQGAIIAAGSIVSNDVPPYAIVGGVPAKVIKYRFSEELIHELLKVDYEQINESIIREHVEDLYEELIRIEQIDWMPKKDITCKETML